MFYCFGFIYKFDVCMLENKTTVLVICIHKRDKSIVFAVSIKSCHELSLDSDFNFFYIYMPIGDAV